MTTPTFHASLKTKKTAIGEIPVEWDVASIGSLCVTFSGGTPSRSSPEHFVGSIPWIKSGELNQREIYRTEEYISEQGLTHSSARLVEPGTNLIALYGATAGVAARSRIRAAINQAVLAVVPKIDDLDPNFLHYVLLTFREQVGRLVQGAQPNLNAELVRQQQIALPPLREQQGISAILGTWDHALDRVENLLVAKKQFKRALMQRLLTGKVRYSEFGREGWKTYRLSGLLERIFRPVTLQDDVALDLISIRRRSGGLFFRGSFTAREFKTRDLNRIEADDFIVSKRQVTHGALAMVRQPFAGMHVSNEYVIFRCKAPEKLHMAFFDWLSRSRRMWHLAYLASNGVHIEKLIFDPTDFLREKIALPPTLREQQRIVELLEASDTETRLLEKELNTLKTQKQGLMQKLLTGKVRIGA